MIGRVRLLLLLLLLLLPVEVVGRTSATGIRIHLSVAADGGAMCTTRRSPDGHSTATALEVETVNLGRVVIIVPRPPNSR